MGQQPPVIAASQTANDRFVIAFFVAESLPRPWGRGKARGGSGASWTPRHAD